MPAKSSEKLPVGWTVQFKAQKTGRKFKYYMNLGTGQKFFCKEDLLRYIKMARTVHESKAASGCSRRCSENINMKPVAKENEHPEWLPDGWVVELKTRKSGCLIGRSYKIYIDPLSGFKFFSKPEVLRYLESTGHKSCTSKQKKTRNKKCCASKVVVEKSTVDDLPPGWIKEMKIRKTSYGVRKDPYYTDPVTGYVFRSKKDVFRYLETGEISRHVFKPAKRDVNDLKALPSPAPKSQKLLHTVTRRRLFPVEEKSSEACSSAFPEADALKKRPGRRVSAETGLAGGTTAETFPEKMVIEKVSKAKETSSVGRPALSRRNQGKMAFADNWLVSTPATDSLQGKNLLESGMECYSNRKSLNNSIKFKYKKKLNFPRRSSKRLAGHEPELVVNCVSVERVHKKATREACKIEAIPAADLSFNGLADDASKKAGPVIEIANCVSSKANIPSNGEQSNKIKPSKNNSIPGQLMQKLTATETNYDKSEQHLPFSLGDSYLDPCLEFAFKTLTGEIPVDCIPDNAPPVSTPVADILQEKGLHETKMENCSGRKTQSNLIKSKKKKELNLPRRSSKRLAGFEPEVVPDSAFNERALINAARKSRGSEAPADTGLYPNVLRDDASEQLEVGHIKTFVHRDSADISTPMHEESSTEGQKPLELQTVSEGQPQKLEKEKPEEQPQEPENESTNKENSESQLLFSFGDSWSDPCLEFAYKTLTGAIPLDDNLAIQDYFQHQLDPTRTQADNKPDPPNIGLPSSLQADVSFQFDAPENQTASEKLPVNPSFLPSGNVSLPSCSSIVSQQPCLEGNKELHGKVKS